MPRRGAFALRAITPSVAVCAVPVALLGLPAASRAESARRRGSTDHVAGTELAIELRAGEWLAVGTCGLAGARHDFDTTLRLRGPDGAEVAYSDDACGSLGSRISHRALETGTYHVVMGCYSGGSCGGRLAWEVDDEEVSVPWMSWDVGLHARALIGPDGQGLVADAWLAARFDELGGLSLRLTGSPMGIAGGRDGGILGGAVHLTAGWDVGFVAIGLGGGISTLSRRAEGVTQREAGVLVLHMRLGAADDFHLGGHLLLAFPADDELDYTFDLEAGLPLGAFELVARGVYGMSGVWLGEVGFVYWPEGTGRRGVGLAVLAGASAVTYQPVCRFGLVCQESLYAGPHVGLGIHVRP